MKKSILQKLAECGFRYTLHGVPEAENKSGHDLFDWSLMGPLAVGGMRKGTAHTYAEAAFEMAEHAADMQPDGEFAGWWGAIRRHRSILAKPDPTGPVTQREMAESLGTSVMLIQMAEAMFSRFVPLLEGGWKLAFTRCWNSTGACTDLLERLPEHEQDFIFDMNSAVMELVVTYAGLPKEEKAKFRAQMRRFKPLIEKPDGADNDI